MKTKRILFVIGCNINGILKKFIGVFTLHGTENTKIRSLCKAGNISSEILYEIYRNKEGIVIACETYVRGKLL